MKKMWRCTVCNDVHYGMLAPEVCPTCQTNYAYVEIDKSEAEFIMEL